MQMRSYGRSGPPVVVVHGGPGAPGMMAPVASALADRFRVFEPFQRPSGAEPLRVADHIADLLDLIESRCAPARPAMVGSSWGAMLALAFAAEHPQRAGPIVLIGCGTFDPAARSRMQATLEERISVVLRQRLDRLPEEIPNPDERLRLMGDLLLPSYSHDPVSTALDVETCDARAYEETWTDMVRLQQEGKYPAAFAAIESPVLMLHGAADPHPGRMILASLQPFLPHIEYHEWKRCGHYPWLERAVREEFFAKLKDWLEAKLAGEAPLHA